jgi:hypothetical protein
MPFHEMLLWCHTRFLTLIIEEFILQGIYQGVMSRLAEDFADGV